MTGRSIVVGAVEFTSVLAIYYLLAEIPHRLVAPLTTLTPLCPPSGVALALLLTRGNVALPGITAGSFLTPLVLGYSVQVAIAAAVAVAISSTVGAYTFRWWLGSEPNLTSVRNVAALSVVTLGPVPLVSSALLTLGAFASGENSSEQVSGWWFWWELDLLASVAVVPLIIAWSSTRISWKLLAETCLACGCAGALAIAAFGPADLVPISRLSYTAGYSPFAFAIAVPLVWTVLRASAALAASTSFVYLISTIACLALTDSAAFDPTLLLPLGVTVSITPLLLAAEFSKWRKAEQCLSAAIAGRDHEIARLNSTLLCLKHQFKTLVEDVSDHVIFLVDSAGRIASWNDAAGRITGYLPQQAIGQPFGMLFRPDERRAGQPVRALELAAEKGKYEFEGWRIKNDGTPFFVTGVLCSIRSQNNELIGFSSLMRDTTERRNAEERLLEAREQLAMAQKMEAIGKLTGGIAHDFNNLLMIIGGNAQTFKRLLDPKLPRAIEAIQTAAKRGEKLTRQLLTFSRNQHLSPTAVDLIPVVRNMRPLIESSLRGNIIYSEAIAETSLPTRVDVAELELAIVNLAVNARDAMPNGGCFTLSLFTSCDAPAIHSHEGFAVLEARDSGTGIPPNLLSKIFDPFFTTKEVGKGTGLGLSQVYGFAHQAGGTVKAESEVGRGTTFRIFLPLYPDLELPTEPAADRSTPSRPKVLVVDDNLGVAEVSSALFEQLGYESICCDSAQSALEYLDTHGEVDLVFSDIVMPGSTDGIGLCKELRERGPKIPIILTTGYSDAVQAVPPDLHVLRKPFDAEALNNIIRKVKHLEQLTA